MCGAAPAWRVADLNSRHTFVAVVIVFPSFRFTEILSEVTSTAPLSRPSSAFIKVGSETLSRGGKSRVSRENASEVIARRENFSRSSLEVKRERKRK
ncbi:hypothetical protein J6590_082011 [Homalodisca vitripennis]|nr:hypothetical protein J6590_082011 [Homalodisca vitripennis]